MLLLIFFDLKKNETFCFVSRFDNQRVVGESNIFGDILIGLFLINRLRYILVPYRSSWLCELFWINGIR